MGATESIDPLDEGTLDDCLGEDSSDDSFDDFPEEDLDSLDSNEEPLDSGLVEDFPEDSGIEDDFPEDLPEDSEMEKVSPLDTSHQSSEAVSLPVADSSVVTPKFPFGEADGSTPYVTSLNFDMAKLPNSLMAGVSSSGDVDFDAFGDLEDLEDYSGAGIDHAEELDVISFHEDEIESYGILPAEETADKAYDDNEVKSYRKRYDASYKQSGDRLSNYINLLYQSEDSLSSLEARQFLINGSLQRNKDRKVYMRIDSTAEIQAQLTSLFRDAASRLNSSVREYTTELISDINSYVSNFKMEFNPDGSIARMETLSSNGRTVHGLFDLMQYAYLERHTGKKYRESLAEIPLDPEFRKELEDVTSYTADNIAEILYIKLAHSHRGDKNIEIESPDLINYISHCLRGCADIRKKVIQQLDKGAHSPYDIVTRRTFEKICSDISNLSEIDYGGEGTALVSGSESSNLHFIMQILKESVKITKEDNSVKETNRYFVYCPTCSKMKEDGTKQRVRIPIDRPLVNLYVLSTQKSESYELYVVPGLFKCPCCSTVMTLSARDLRYIRDDIKPQKNFDVTETSPGFRKYMSNIESVIVPNSFVEFSLGAKKIEKIYITHGDNALFKSVDSIVEISETNTEEEEEDEVAYNDYERYVDEEYESASREFWKRLKGFGKASKEVFIDETGRVNDPPHFIQSTDSVFSSTGESILDEEGNLMNNQAGMKYRLVSSLDRRVTNTSVDESKLTYKSVAAYLMTTLNIDPIIAKNEALFSLMLRLNSDCLLQDISNKGGLIRAESDYVRMVLLFDSLDQKEYEELKVAGSLVSDTVKIEAKSVLPDLIGSVTEEDFKTVDSLDNLINRISNKQRELSDKKPEQWESVSATLSSIIQNFLLYKNLNGTNTIALGARATLNRVQNLEPAYRVFLEKAAEFAEGLNGKRLYSRAYHELLHDNKELILSRYQFLITEELAKIQDLIEILEQSIRPLSFTNIVRTNNVAEYDYNLFVYDDRLTAIIDEITDRMIITNNIGQFYKYWISFDNVPKDLKKAKTAEALQQKLFNVGSQLSNTIIEHIRGDVELSYAECDCLSAAAVLSLADLNAVQGISNGAKINSFYDMLRYAVSLNPDNNYFGFKYKSIYKKAAESVRNFAITIFSSIAASIVDEEKSVVHLTEIQFYLCMAGFTWEEVKKENTAELPNIKFSMWMVKRRSGETPLDYVNRVNKDDYNKDDKFTDFIGIIRKGGVYNDFSIVEMAASLKGIMYENYNASVYMIGMIDIAVNYCDKAKGLDLIHFNKQVINNLVDDLYYPGYTNGSIAIDVLNPSVFSTSLSEVAEFVTESYRKRVLYAHKPLDQRTDGSSNRYFSFSDYYSTLNETIDKLNEFVGADLDVGDMDTARQAVASEFIALYNRVADPTFMLHAELDIADSVISQLVDLENNYDKATNSSYFRDLSSNLESVVRSAKESFDKRNANKKAKSKNKSGFSGAEENRFYFTLDAEDYQQSVRLIAVFWAISLRQDTSNGDYALIYLTDESGSDVGFYLNDRFFPVGDEINSNEVEDGYNSFLEYRYPAVFFKIKDEDKIVNDVTDECYDDTTALSVYDVSTEECVGVLHTSGLFKESNSSRPHCAFNEFYSERYAKVDSTIEVADDSLTTDSEDSDEDDGSDWYGSED